MNKTGREPTHVYPGPGLVLLIDFLHAYHKAGCKKKYDNKNNKRQKSVLSNEIRGQTKRAGASSAPLEDKYNCVL